MKVSGTKGSAGRTSGTGGAGKASKKSGDQVPKLEPITQKPGVDAVEVSDHMTTIEVIRNIVNETPVIRADEVERVSKMLKNGSYKINYEKVAEAFIRDVITNEIARKTKRGGKR